MINLGFDGETFKKTRWEKAAEFAILACLALLLSNVDTSAIKKVIVKMQPISADTNKIFVVGKIVATDGLSGKPNTITINSPNGCIVKNFYGNDFYFECPKIQDLTVTMNNENYFVTGSFKAQLRANVYGVCFIVAKKSNWWPKIKASINEYLQWRPL